MSALSFTVVDAHGTPLRHVNIAGDLELHDLVQPPETAIEGPPPAEPSYWDAGAWVPLPARPSPHHQWDGAQRAWADLRDIAFARAAKNNQINQWRLDANNTSFMFQGHEIQCDKLSRGDIDGVCSEVSLTGSLPATFPGAWKTKDNAWVPIPDVATWTLFVQAMVAQGAVNFTHAQALKVQLASATTLAEVDAIVW
jgi:hypothetical protein